MNRLPIIVCVLALIGAACSTVLLVRSDNAKSLLELQLSDSTSRGAKLETDLASASTENTTLKTNLTTATNDLGTTKSKLTASEAHAAQLDRDLAQAKSLLAFQEQNSRALTTEVSSLRQDLDDARKSNASPEAVTAYKNTIAELERQLANSRNGAAAPTAAGAATAVFASRAGRATVLTVGPSNAFVVLNFGTARGAQVGQHLAISQGTENVATVLISDVRTNFSVAQVQPDTLRGVLQKGDSALLIR